VPFRLSSWLRGKYDEEQKSFVLPAGEARAAALLLLHVQQGEFANLPPAPIRFTSDYLRLTGTVATNRGRCGEACSFHRTCAFYPIYQARSHANVVVVNHALLFQTFLQGKDDLDGLPLTQVIVDEAHDLSEAAYAALRREVSVQGLRALVNELLEIRPRRLGETGRTRGEDLLGLLDQKGPHCTTSPRCRDACDSSSPTPPTTPITDCP